MSSPWRRTFPSTLAFGIVSCIRFKQRMRVDFPQPEGPMTAVTMWLSMSIVMSWMANFSPYQAESDSTRSFSAIAGSPRHGTEPDDDARGDAEPEHHEDEDQGDAPGRLVLSQVRTGGPDVDRVRERLDGLVDSPKPIVVSKGGHEERSRFARDPGNSQEASRDQRAARGRDDHPEDGPIPGNPQGEGRFPHRDGHQTQGLFRGPRYERDHDGGQREDSRNRAEDEARAPQSDQSQL